MVLLAAVQSSNARIKSVLPPGLVAVFVGATNGIGETTLKQFAKYSRQPCVYFVGRSQEAGDRIAVECKSLNPEGKFIFLKADISLIRTVDNVYWDSKAKEKSINLLFMTQGTLVTGVETAEGLHLAAALPLNSRNRFLVNLLPLIEQATALRRVVSVFIGALEGPIDTTNIRLRHVPLMKARGHGASLATLSLEALQKKAPKVSFIHDFPSPVKSGIARGTSGPMRYFAAVISTTIGKFIYIPNQECGERHLFLETSARYPGATDEDTAPGIPLANGVPVAAGTTGKAGSGVYTLDQNCESAGSKVVEILAQLREESMIDAVWKDTEEQFLRTNRTEAI